MPNSININHNFIWITAFNILFSLQAAILLEIHFMKNTQFLQVLLIIYNKIVMISLIILQYTISFRKYYNLLVQHKANWIIFNLLFCGFEN